MSKKKDLLRAALMDIANEFDYDEIHEYYNSVDWRWSYKSELAVPTSEVIKQFVYDRIDSLVKNKSTFVGSGGITVHQSFDILMIYFHDHNNDESIRFGQIHGGESPLISVAAYWEHIDRKAQK